MAVGPDICEPGGAGIILPLFGDDENSWPRSLRGILYILGLGWCFMGVALVAEKFMEAIEKVTAKRVRKFNPKTNRYMTVEVWNETVANLTLMALGSSAPEILLSVIELLIINEMYSGDLGPSTIVGSAAFNLFMITAVCIYVIPDGEHRRIKEVPVYVVTAIFSVFAYLWLLLILTWFTPDIVTILEGVVTFLFFPVLVIIAYAADRGAFTREVPELGDPHIVSARNMDPEELAELECKVRKEVSGGHSMSTEQVERIIANSYAPRASRATYRVAATRALTAGRRVSVPSRDGEEELRGKKGISGALQHASSIICSTWSGNAKVCPQDMVCAEAALSEGIRDFESSKGSTAPSVTIEFQSARHAVLENCGSVRVEVRRTGDETVATSVKYTTREGTAKPDMDYKGKEGVLHFAPGVVSQTIEVEMVDDNAYEEDEEFFVDLYEPEGDGVVLGVASTATILIIDDDHAGELRFPQDTLKVAQTFEDQSISVAVERRGGASGEVRCTYHTEEDSALENLDFLPAQGELVFESGIQSRTIPLTIKGRGRYERTEMFRVILTDPTGGAVFDRKCDGGPDKCILSVMIEVSEEQKQHIDRVMSAMRVGWDKAKVGHSNWRDQFRDAIFVNGDSSEEDGEAPSLMDYAMHVILFPWKLFFAIVPPTNYCGGWMCFVSSLLMIGVVTLLVGELANLLGCVLDMPNEITAITLVALGTSLPDTFASMEAAQKDRHADASICNVTGSNSVNVFLGVGLPWMVGACYWKLVGATDEWKQRYPSFLDTCPHGCFVVEAKGLAVSVSIFSGCALVALVTLYVRRRLCEGELGGPRTLKLLSSCLFVSLWVIYIVLSAIVVLSKSD